MLTMPADELKETFVLHNAVQTNNEKLDEITHRPSGDGERFYRYSFGPSLLLSAQIDFGDSLRGSVFDVKTHSVALIG